MSTRRVNLLTYRESQEHGAETRANTLAQSCWLTSSKIVAPNMLSALENRVGLLLAVETTTSNKY